MDDPQPAPAITARDDQDGAAIAELLTVARQHLTGCCAHPHVCGADDVYRHARDRALPARLLGVAIMRLAQLEPSTQERP